MKRLLTVAVAVAVLSFGSIAFARGYGRGPGYGGGPGYCFEPYENQATSPLPGQGHVPCPGVA